MATTNKNRTYGAAHFALEFDDDKKNAGYFHSFEGGGITAEIKTHQTGNQLREWSQIGFPKYDDITVEVGMAMSKSFYDWISAFFDGDIIRKSGAVVAGDFHYKERARREMYEMVISKVSIPALDADNKDSCHMGVTIVPERVVFKKGSNKEIPHAKTKTPNSPKLWTAANFMVRIDGFEDACKRIRKVDAFEIKSEILEHRVGNLRDSIRVPGRLELPTISMHLPESDAQPFIDHFVKYTQEGAPQTAPRLTGEIECRGHDQKALCSIEMFGLDISAITPSKSQARSEDVKTIKLDFSLETIKFTYK